MRLFGLGLVFFIASCAKLGFINRHSLELGQVPKDIIWVQIPGFHMQHLSILKIANFNDELLALEKVHCYGQMWDYNLTDLRPSTLLQLQAELSGRPNSRDSLKGEKSEKKLMFNEIWKNWNHVDPHAMVRIKGPDKYPDINLSKENASQIFGKSSDVLIFNSDRPHRDFFDNLAETFKLQQLDNKKSFMLVQLLDYQHLIEQNRPMEVSNYLKEFNLFLETIISKRNSKTLILITSQGAKPLQMPIEGAPLRQVLQGKKPFLERNSDFLSPSFAMGARAENFCGIYKHEEVLSRLGFEGTGEGFKYYLINPFD